MYGDHRMLIEVVPDDIKKMWNEQALRGSILVSLVLQIILSVLGNLRKYNPTTRIRTTLWCVYFLAYAVVPGALTISAQIALEVCNNDSNDQNSNTKELMTFWASFLLLHLGGPDTITAYSSEDNKLWLRHMLFLVSQSFLALYILLLSWPGCSHLPFLSIFIYVCGCIKCVGRVQALRLASPHYLRESMLRPADPGPDYVKFVEEYKLRKSQGFIVKVEEIPEPPLQVFNAYPKNRSKEVLEAYDLFQTFKQLFVDPILTYEDRDSSTSYFHRLDSDEAFRVVEIELGFAYDKLYTKATVVYTDKGLILRAISGVLILFILVGFCILPDMDDYQVSDVVITFLLFATEVSKEIFAVFTLLRSDWTDLWLNQHNRTRSNIFIFPFLKQPSKQRWSNSIAQLDLLSVALEEKPASFLRIQKLFGVDEYQEKRRYETYNEVSANLKDMIYSQFKSFMDSNSENKPLCIHRGSYSLQLNNCSTLLWSTSDVEFDESILIWHIATSLCYYSEVNDNDEFGINRLESNHISNYMVSLLVSNPDMLPIGIGMTRYRDTCADAKRFFKTKHSGNQKADACRKLLEVDCTELLPSIVKGDRSKSVLFDGCRLALALREMEREPMWKVVSQVWIEILGYAAAHCRGFHHSQQLGRGGEFLTHVWLLMAHLGLTQHFQVYRGHARARFNKT